MNARATKKLVAGGALGAMLIGTVALASAATADPIENEGVDVSVNIEGDVPTGNLALSVASGSTTLTEADQSSVEGTREFNGALPDVTVTDTRTVDQIPDGAFWYVLGNASDFVGDAGQENIGAENLGWAPALVDGGESGLVDAGLGVEPELEGGEGLVEQDLLTSTLDSADVNAEGSWTVNAALTLRTPADVAAGAYSSTITLSLFED